MKAEPIKQCGLPDYPTRDEVLANRGFLARYLPKGWKSARGLAGAAAVIVAGNMAGCGGPTLPPPPTTVGEIEAVLAAHEEWEMRRGRPDPLVDIAQEWVDSLLADPAPVPPPGPPALGGVIWMPDPPTEGNAFRAIRDRLGEGQPGREAVTRERAEQ